MADRPVPMDTLWRQIREVGPPPGARERILDSIEGRRARRRRIWLPVLAVAGAAVALLWAGGGAGSGESRDPDGPGRAAVAEPGPPASESAGPGPSAEPEELRVKAGRRASLDTGAARLEVEGPAAIVMEPDRVTVRRGTVEVDGAATVRGPSCTAALDGRCRVTVEELKTTVTVVAGSAHVIEPSVTCQVVHAEDTADKAAKTASRRPRRVRDEPRPAPEPSGSLLTRQLDAYDGAMALRESAPDRALRRLRAQRDRWPRSDIAHEIDVAIFEILVEADRLDAARREARRFLRRYPRSPKADAVREVLR